MPTAAPKIERSQRDYVTSYAPLVGPSALSYRALYSAALREGLVAESYVSDGLLSKMTSSTYALDRLDLSKHQQTRILGVYMQALHQIFVFFTVCSGLSLVLTCWVGNMSLKAPKPMVDGYDDMTNDAGQLPSSQVIDGQGANADMLSTAEQGIHVDDHHVQDKLRSEQLEFSAQQMPRPEAFNEPVQVKSEEQGIRKEIWGS